MRNLTFGGEVVFITFAGIILVNNHAIYKEAEKHHE